jgi:hypothetical protein
VENLTKRQKIIPAMLVFAALATWFGAAQYREHVRCVMRNSAFQEQIAKLERDAHAQLRVGVNKDQVVRFFEEHQMTVTFDRGEASGNFQTTGCAPFGCGADTATIVVSVAVDPAGTVSGPSHVYTDCL